MAKITVRDQKGRIAKGSNYQHGMSDEPIYDCWVAMKARCNNPTHPMYKHYGKRGIKVCDRWQKSFIEFYKDMGEMKQGYTIDRINVNGDYEPSNCRWATIQEQQKNKRNNNKYPGVEYEPSRDKYRALIKYKGKRYFLGRFEREIDAIIARTKAEERLYNA